jgi:ABC-type Fe3+/spermidine/putrescine transport system ATPase subunit
MAYLELKMASKSYGAQQILEDLSFEIGEGEVLAVLGKSGCGKSTLLKGIAGLEAFEQGELRLAGRDYSQLKSNQREMVYLYQAPLLFPHLNVFENIAFGLRLRKLPKAEVKAAVEEMLSALELEGLADRKPHQLSGGQQQRVAFGRAIIIQPKVLLLDEPFGKLDSQTRAKMQQLFQDIRKKYKITAILVTHDLKEALLMGDRLAYMEAGKLEVYPNREAFLTDPRTGVQEELDFWKGLDLDKK